MTGSQQLPSNHNDQKCWILLEWAIILKIYLHNYL